MLCNNISIYNRCNVQTEEPSITTSKVIVYFEIQFSREKRDINFFPIDIYQVRGIFPITVSLTIL